MAFLFKRSNTKNAPWRIVWQDARKGAGRRGRREANCVNGDHAEALQALKQAQHANSPMPAAATNLINGATTKRERIQLLVAYEALERQCTQQSLEASLDEVRFDFDFSLDALMDRYLEGLRGRQSESRDRPFGSKARKTNDAYELAFVYFKRFLRHEDLGSLPCGRLQPHILSKFGAWLEAAKGRRTKKPVSDATFNQVMRSMRAFLRAVGSEADGVRYFRRPLNLLLAALKTRPSGDVKEPRHFSAPTIQDLLNRAWKLDQDRSIEVTRSKRQLGNTEQFSMATLRTPIFPWLALLLLTGARPHELADLKWGDYDPDRGMLMLTSTKLKRRRSAKGRRLVLNDKRWPISPTLIALLNAWGKGADQSAYILPADARTKVRTVPRRSWRRLAEDTSPRIRPYDLRANWVTWMVGQGHPQPIVALLAGHRPDVQSEHYLTLPVDAAKAADLESAMGITGILQMALEAASKDCEKS
ncbi:MAG: tyrosine-type recombinase/integrase [Planctomycetes bacterium]|nr:tyrosine-type recombinase/integrase [Planctomycetota bacterium]